MRQLLKRLPKISFIPESQVSARRRVIAMTLAVLAVVVSSWGDFFEFRLRWPGLVGLVAVSSAAALVSTVVFDGVRLEARRAEQRVHQNLRLLRRAARTVPQGRQAPVLSDFRGREDELRTWEREHARLRRLHGIGEHQQQSPVVLAMHGPPGVGKSALAHALSRRLAKEYPHGLYVASFQTGGTARGPADIVRDLLLQLGWPEKDMQVEAEDRVSTLRSLTRGKRMLFLFDAAADHDQVNAVMPAEPGCGVIVTSRREIGSSLGLPPRPPVASLKLHDALEMFSAIAGIDWTRDAETAVELVELCDRLPLAVQAVAERVRDEQGLRYVASIMRPARSRLHALDYGGRNLQARIGSEFDRLSPTQRRALTLLASLDSESFVPWVLRPLLNLEHGDSTAVVTGLAAAQFVEQDGQDHTGQARYRIHPLMRLYAIRMQDPTDVAAATHRFTEAYVELIDEVLSIHDSTAYGLIRTGPRVWRSEHSTIAGRISVQLDHIVRREYLNLVRIIRVADPRTHAALIWRVAAMLDGRTPAFPPSSRTADEQALEIAHAFDHGIAAAKACGTLVGEVDVRLAQTQFLIAVERYRAAASNLDEIEQIINGAQTLDSVPMRLRVARVRAWLFLVVGSYGKASEVLRAADTLIDQLTDQAIDTPHVQTDIELIRRFNEDIHRVTESHRWGTMRRGQVGSHDIVDFHARMAQIEELRRRGYWDNAAALLRDLLGRDGDARSHTSTHYRLAQFQVEHALHLDEKDEHREKVIREAIQHAAACTVTFGTIGDAVGQVRGRALLVRALVLAGSLVAATQLDIEIEADLHPSARRTGTEAYVEALNALYHQAHAEVEIAHGRTESGWRSLTQALQAFRRLEDWSNHADTSRVLHETYPKIPNNRQAIEETSEDKQRLAQQAAPRRSRRSRST